MNDHRIKSINSMDTKLLRAETNLYDKFLYLPEKLGYAVRKDHSIQLVNAGLGSSMFNIACKTAFQEEFIESDVEEVITYFNSQPFAWWLGPSHVPLSLGPYLETIGARIETIEYAMWCELNSSNLLEISSPLQISLIHNQENLQDFIGVLSPYDAAALPFYSKIINWVDTDLYRLFVGHAYGKATTIGSLFFSDGVAGIYDVITNENERGKGYATSLMQFMMSYAKNLGYHHASLSASSEEGLRIYERLGFIRLGEFQCYEYK